MRIVKVKWEGQVW